MRLLARTKTAARAPPAGLADMLATVNSDSNMTCMQKFDFNRPFNVTLIVEDLGIDQYSRSIGTHKLCQNTNTQDNANNKPPPATFRHNAEREYINRSNNILNKDKSPTNNIHYQGDHFINAPSENVAMYKRQLIYTLDRLSESIIKIANSFHNTYKGFTNVSYQNERVFKEITLKKQEFYNTLSIIATSIILMQEKNYVFIKKFVSRTVQIAHLKSFYHITSDIINYFIVDLINWRKNQSPRLEIGSKTRHPLSQVTKTIYKTRKESKRRKNELNSVRLFSYGSSENQITLDIDSQLFNRIVNSKSTECEPAI